MISGAKTSSLARGADDLSKRANTSEDYYCRALKHVSLMFIISALIDWLSKADVGGAVGCKACERMFQAFAHSGPGGVGATWKPPKSTF